MNVTVEKKTISFCTNLMPTSYHYGWPKTKLWPCDQNWFFLFEKRKYSMQLILSNKKTHQYQSWSIGYFEKMEICRKKKQDWEQSMTANIWKSEGFLKTNSSIHVFLFAKSQEKTWLLTFIFLITSKVLTKKWKLTKSKIYKIKSSLMSKKKYFTRLMNILFDIKGPGIQIVYILDSTFFFPVFLSCQ